MEQTLDSLAWDRIECLDKDGKLLGPAIERDGGSDEEEFEEFDEGVSMESVRGILRDAMRVNLEIMRTTMRETRQIFDAQTKSQTDLVTAFSESMRVVQDSYAIALKVQTAQLVTGAQPADGDEMTRMMQMAMMMMAKGQTPPQRPEQPRKQVVPPPMARPANPVAEVK
jgi:hypothetical protein